MVGPIVGSPPDYELEDGDVPWVLGTQLTTSVGPVARADPGTPVLLIEAHEFADRKRYHVQKLTLLFAAMRQYRDRLRDRGYDVTYVQADTFRDGLARFFDEYPDARLVTMRSPSYRSAARFVDLVEAVGGDIRVVENELFVSTRAAFDEWANDRDGSGFEHERFYRWMRRESGVLMENGDPAGGEWNYDDQNREFPPEDWESPPLPDHDHGPLVERTREWVRERFDTWGDPEPFDWPVTRTQARQQLDQFVSERLPEFGPYQDAMRSDDPTMAHALLGGAINLGLVHPVEAIGAAEDAYDRGDAPLSSVEGFIRQVLGWREFMRHVYRHAMPELATANRLDADRDLPELYWSGETDMHCLSETVEDVATRGYSHHIQRLMILSNFATLWGVDPSELNEWFHATYVDAYHWVTTPNVIEMGSYAHGAFATKPYVSSANYVDRMSDYCSDCRYHKTKDVGEGACPFNALYWDFLARNEDDLRSNHRMGLMYSHVDDKRESGDMEAIEERVEELRVMAAAEEL